MDSYKTIIEIGSFSIKTIIYSELNKEFSIIGTGKTRSKGYTGQEIENISKLFSEKLFEEEKISIVKTPQGSENLNPPEVMLIATESNASFVVNGIISDENNSSFLNLKVYEAKRGSLIINQKISISENNGNLIDFTSNFKKDVLKK